MGMTTERDQLEHVYGEIAFHSESPKHAGERSSPGYGNEKNRRDIMIRNARPILKQLSLDREGFTLIRHQSSCAFEGDAALVGKQYVEEMIPFIQDYFQAAWLMSRPDAVFLRRAGLAVTDGVDGTSVPGVRVPLNSAHIDYMAVAGPMLAARETQLRGLPIRSYRRLMIVNTWRTFSPPPQDFPLALCDSSTVADSDIVGNEYTDKASGSTWWTGGGVRSNSRHCWYYFPEMTADEAPCVDEL